MQKKILKKLRFGNTHIDLEYTYKDPKDITKTGVFSIRGHGTKEHW